MIKHVLVYLYSNADHKAVISAAARFAKAHEAQLEGLFVTPDFMNYSTIYGHYPLNLAEAFHAMQKEFADTAKEQFESISAGIGCAANWHQLSENDAQVKPALYADYLFVAQPSVDGNVVFNDQQFVDNLIIDTGLPTVVIPATWSSNDLGSRITVGWKETREAAGALRHTLALLRTADKVDVVSVAKASDPDAELIEGVEISHYLAAHEVNCEFFSKVINPSANSVTETLLQHADESNSNMIIIGGYGHSRLREIILGGVTRGLLRKSSVPLLLSH